MDIFTILWLVWLAAFGVIEGVALKRKAAGDTLSEHVRLWFATAKHPTGPLGRVRRLTLLAFMAWLTVHFLVPGFV